MMNCVTEISTLFRKLLLDFLVFKDFDFLRYLRTGLAESNLEVLLLYETVLFVWLLGENIS